MSGEIPLSERVAAFRRHTEGAPQRKVSTLSEEQKVELGKQATDLLGDLMGIAGDFLATEEIDQVRERKVTSFHLTPFVMEDDSAFAITVERSRYFDAIPVDGDDQIGAEEVTASILLAIPEMEKSLPIIRLEGAEDNSGEIRCTQISFNDDFFLTAEDKEQGKPLDQLAAVAEAKIITDHIKEKLGSGHGVIFVNGKEGHVLVARKQGHEEQSVFIPHAGNRGGGQSGFHLPNLPFLKH